MTTAASLVARTKAFLNTLHHRSKAYNYTSMDREAANFNAAPRHLEPVTQMPESLQYRPPDSPPPPEDSEESSPECDLCTSVWAAKQFPNLWCASVLADCGHAFCTMCTIRVLARHTYCPSCETTIPYYKQAYLREQQTDFAAEHALETVHNDDEHLPLYGLLANYDMKSDEIRQAAERVARFLKAERLLPNGSEKALIDMPLLGPEIVAFANMSVAFRAACGNDFSAQEREQWVDVTVALYDYLERQRELGQEVNAKALLEVLENNIDSSLREEIEYEVARSLEALFAYVVHVCQEAWIEWQKLESRRGRRVLRRRSKSKLGK